MSKLKTIIIFLACIFWILLEGVIFVRAFGADLSPSVQTFAMANGRNWGLGIDTSWEAQHFDYMFVNMLDTTLINRYKYFNPDFKVIQYALAADWVSNEEAWDSLKSYFGADSEEALIHTKYNTLHYVFEPSACPATPNPQIICGWDADNDTVGGADGVRDYVAFCSTSTSHGTDWVEDSVRAWTPNEWQDYGVYNYYGGLCGIIDSNSAKKIYYTYAGDTSNILTNGGFEDGNLGNGFGYVNLGNNFNDDSNFTIECWVKLDTLPSEVNRYFVVIAKSGNASDFDLLIDKSNDKPTFYFSAGANKSVQSSSALLKHTWYHLATVWDRDNDSLFMYVDGIRMGQTGGVTGSRATNSNNLTLGKSAYYSNRYLDGKLTDVRFWTVVRTTNQILVYKDSVLTGLETGLRDYYKCQEGMGDTIYDSGIRGIKGSLNDVGWINDAVHNYSLSFINSSEWQKATSCTDSSQFFIDNTIKHSGSYSAKIVHKCPAPNQPSYLLFEITSPETLINYGIAFWYKTTDTLYCKVAGLSTNLYTNGTFDIPITADSFDGNWHRYWGTFATAGVSIKDTIRCYLGFQSSHGAHYEDSAWFDDVEIRSYGKFLISVDGYYPYVLDDTLAVDHRASAMAEKNARVRSYAWCYNTNQYKYATNVGNTTYRNFWCEKWLPYLIATYKNYDGFMVDNIDDEMPNVGSFEYLNEYGTYPTRKTQWNSDIYTLFTRGRDTCANHSFELFANTVPPHDSGFGSNLNGLVDEGAFSPYRFKASDWTDWVNNTQLGYGYNRDEGWGKIKFLDSIGTKQFIMEGYHSYIDDYDTNRTQITAYAHYLCIAGDSTYFQSEWASTWESNLTGQWLSIFSYDIGDPLDTCYQVAQGTDVNGHNYLIVGRKYARGTDTTLVLFKPMWAGTATMYSYTADPTLTAVSLPDGHWFELMSNGQFSRNVYSDTKPIYLRYNQGAILRRCSCK